jgi:hypothetical protein
LEQRGPSISPDKQLRDIIPIAKCGCIDKLPLGTRAK